MLLDRSIKTYWHVSHAHQSSYDLSYGIKSNLSRHIEQSNISRIKTMQVKHTEIFIDIEDYKGKWAGGTKIKGNLYFELSALAERRRKNVFTHVLVACTSSNTFGALHVVDRNRWT